MRIWLLFLFLAGSALAAPLAEHRLLRRPVTLNVKNGSLEEVLKQVAAQAECHVLIGPGVKGKLTFDCAGQPLEVVLQRVVPTGKTYWTVGDYLVVGDADFPPSLIMVGVGPEILLPPVRQEFILERAPAARVVEFLAGDYRLVKFIPHPTMNGFYAVGPKKDILEIKARLRELDIEPPR